MKKINLLAISFIGAFILLVNFNWKYAGETIIFQGFANNKELNINLENPATVKALHVQPGQRVKKGDLLVEVTRPSIEISQSDINNDILTLQSQFQVWESGLRNSIRTLKAQKNERKNELESAISKLESEININAKLIKEIQSIDQVTDKYGSNPRQIELDGLKADLSLSMATFDSSIRKLQRELNNSNHPLHSQIEKLNDNLEFVNEEEQSLRIFAQHEGVIGTILCKVGENIPAFTSFLTMYEESPNHVKGYVLENLILKVDFNDTLIIQSVSNPEETTNGVVTGMGSRIVEIPPRLRKNPDLISYGREVEIKIPSQNPFLQNEKVSLKKYTAHHKSLILTDVTYTNN